VVIETGKDMYLTDKNVQKQVLNPQRTTLMPFVNHVKKMNLLETLMPFVNHVKKMNLQELFCTLIIQNTLLHLEPKFMKFSLLDMREICPSFYQIK
jgi:hypothetical protein